jgi:uncharacterized protein (TIGR02058 family)
MEKFNEKTALVLVDLQNDFCHPNGTAAGRGKDVHAFGEKLKNIKDLLGIARERNIPVIHVVSEHSVWTESPSGKERFGRSDQDGHLSYCEPGSWGAEIYHAFSPNTEEKIVVKHRYSAFLHTDLELILRRNGIEHIVITGGYTNVCIDTTARDASMRDFFVSVPYDCVISDNEKLHNAALKLLNGTFADIVHSNEIKSQWKGESSMKEILFIETGTGVDLHGQDVNEAAARAVIDAIHYNSMPGIRKMLPDQDIHNMKVNVKLGIPKDLGNLDEEKIKKLFPYGTVTVETMTGGMATTSGIFLEDQKDKNDLMYIVNAVVEVGY